MITKKERASSEKSLIKIQIGGSGDNVILNSTFQNSRNWASLNGLPSELVVKISFYLKYSDLVALSRTSKKMWKEIAKTPAVSLVKKKNELILGEVVFENHNLIKKLETEIQDNNTVIIASKAAANSLITPCESITNCRDPSIRRDPSLRYPLVMIMSIPIGLVVGFLISLPFLLLHNSFGGTMFGVIEAVTILTAMLGAGFCLYQHKKLAQQNVGMDQLEHEIGQIEMQTKPLEEDAHFLKEAPKIIKEKKIAYLQMTLEEPVTPEILDLATSIIDKKDVSLAPPELLSVTNKIENICNRYTLFGKEIVSASNESLLSEEDANNVGTKSKL